MSDNIGQVSPYETTPADGTRKPKKNKTNLTAKVVKSIEYLNSDSDVHELRRCNTCDICHPLHLFAKDPIHNATAVCKSCKKARMRNNAKLQCLNYIKRRKLQPDEIYRRLLDNEESGVRTWAAQLQYKFPVVISETEIDSWLQSVQHVLATKLCLPMIDSTAPVDRQAILSSGLSSAPYSIGTPGAPEAVMRIEGIIPTDRNDISQPGSPLPESDTDPTGLEVATKGPRSESGDSFPDIDRVDSDNDLGIPRRSGYIRLKFNTHLNRFVVLNHDLGVRTSPRLMTGPASSKSSKFEGPLCSASPDSSPQPQAVRETNISRSLDEPETNNGSPLPSTSRLTTSMPTSDEFSLRQTRPWDTPSAVLMSPPTSKLTDATQSSHASPASTLGFQFLESSDIAEDMLDDYIDTFCQARNAAREETLAADEASKRAAKKLEDVRNMLATCEYEHETALTAATTKKRTYEIFAQGASSIAKTIEERVQSKCEQFEAGWQALPTIGRPGKDNRQSMVSQYDSRMSEYQDEGTERLGRLKNCQ